METKIERQIRKADENFKRATYLGQLGSGELHTIKEFGIVVRKFNIPEGLQKMAAKKNLSIMAIQGERNDSVYYAYSEHTDRFLEVRGCPMQMHKPAKVVAGKSLSELIVNLFAYLK